MLRETSSCNRALYRASRWLGGRLLSWVCRLERRGEFNLPSGPCVLVCNHISHFDPPLLVTAIPRVLEMMAMQELFTYPWLAAWLRGVGVFPVNRYRADIKAVRIALRRLQRGGTVVVFPEAGIRTGADSVLGGATIKRGAAGLAQVTGVSVIPCLSIGSDQLYDPKQWFQRPRMIFYLGSALHADQRLKKREARMALTEKIGQSLRTMYHQLEREGALTSDLVPRSAQERWQSVPESTGSMLAEE